MADESIFLRRTSGLVRSARPTDVLVYNLGLISVGIAISLSFFFIPANYAGANLVLALVFSGVMMAVIAFVFWCWTVTIPRSGGAYAFVTRGLNPMLGFTVSFVDSFVWLFYNAFAATFLVLFGLAPFLFYMGLQSDSEALVNLAISLERPVPLFLVAAAAITFSGWILTRGMRRFFALQRYVFALALVGTAVTIVVLFRSTASEFTEAFEASYGRFLTLPQSESRVGAVTGFQVTLAAAVWPLLSFVGSIFSVNIAGEIQNVRRSQLIGMFGSIAAAIGLMAILSMSFNSTVPAHIQVGIGEYVFSGREPGFPIQPYFSALVVPLARTPLTAFLICAGFAAWAYMWLPATITYSARAVLAWSFDRLAPEKLGAVHPTRFTPTNAIVAVTVTNLGLLALFVFVPFFTNLILVLAAMIAWLPIMLAAIVFPYRRPSIYAGSPIAGWRLAGVPVMTLAGILGTLAVGTIVWFLFRDPVAAGPSAVSLGTLAVLFAVSATWYVLAVVIRKKQNIDIRRAFAEIPIE